MTERPILFSGDMVRAILDGRKTQTRRVCKFLSNSESWSKQLEFERGINDGSLEKILLHQCPYGTVGDRLWVRETWRDTDAYSGTQTKPYIQAIQYRSDLSSVSVLTNESVSALTTQDNDLPWKPSIFMPRWASRITLEVTGVRVQRVQEIDCVDAVAEGTPDLRTMENGWDMRDCYRELWDSINGKRRYGWDVNPWVWVVEFRRVEQ